MSNIERALNIQQPWAWLIVNGIKNIELDFDVVVDFDCPDSSHLSSIRLFEAEKHESRVIRKIWGSFSRAGALHQGCLENGAMKPVQPVLAQLERLRHSAVGSPPDGSRRLEQPGDLQ